MSDLLRCEVAASRRHLFQRLLPDTNFQEPWRCREGPAPAQPWPVAKAAASGFSVAHNTNLFIVFLSWFKIAVEKGITKNPQVLGHLA